MSHLKLKAQPRTKIGKASSKTLSLENKIPAVIYGPKSDNKNIELSYSDFNRVFDQAGKSTLIDLEVGDTEPIKVLVHDFSINPLTDRYNHIDFYELDMDKKLEVEVELNLIGESPAVKEKNAELIKILDTISVECLPRDLVKNIDIDLSQLKDIGEHIYTKDIILPSGLELVTDPDLVVVSAEEIKEVIIEESPAEAETKEGESGKGESAGKEGKADKEEAGAGGDSSKKE